VTSPQSIYPALKPGLLLVPLNSDEFFIGESSDGLYIPSDPYISIVRACDGRHTTDAIATTSGLPHGLILDFLDELRAHNYIEFRSHLPIDPGLDELARHYSERIAPEHELFTWREATSDGGEGEVDARKHFIVLIFGQNRLARAILSNLQASGFSQSRIISPLAQAGARITARDICGITTRPIDIGRKLSEFHKEITLNSQLTQYQPPYNQPYRGDGSSQIQMRSESGSRSQGGEKSVNLLISTTAATSDYLQRWISEGIPHLQIAQPTTHTLEIGPLVIPGECACLNCVQLHRRDFLPPFMSLAALGSLVYPRGRELTAASTSFAAGVITPYICEFAARGSSSLKGIRLLSIYLNHSTISDITIGISILNAGVVQATLSFSASISNSADIATSGVTLMPIVRGRPTVRFCATTRPLSKS